MTKIFVEYAGDLHCRVRHEPSGAFLETDAPVDNQGKGEFFSPTDLVAAALASCIGITIAIFSKRHDWDLTGMHLEVEKIMVRDPQRRIGRLPIKIWMPKGFSKEQQQILEKVALTCPVHKSLHPQIDAPIHFHWPA